MARIRRPTVGYGMFAQRISKQHSGWTQLGSAVTISSSSNNAPVWTTLATATTTEPHEFRYIEIEVSYNLGGAGDLYIDFIAVAW